MTDNNSTNATMPLWLMHRVPPSTRQVEIKQVSKAEEKKGRGETTAVWRAAPTWATALAVLMDITWEGDKVGRKEGKENDRGRGRAPGGEGQTQ